MKRTIAIIFLLFSAIGVSQGKLRLPSVIGDNMVLQQKSDVNIWGWSDPGKTVNVTASWGSSAKAKAGADGKWSVSISTPEASFEKRSLTISDGDKITLSNILIGEVWLCSGQSNMQIEVQGGRDCPIENSQDILLESIRYPDIRLFNVQLAGGEEVSDDVTGKWAEASPSTVKTFSAVGYLFSKYLREALNVPVGIIESACGGTWIEAWFPAELQKGFADFDPASVNRPGGNGMNTCEHLYNGMIYPLHNFTLKGFIWYQGETNVGRSSCYADKMAALIKNWRDIWGGEPRPFYYVELAPFYSGEDNVDYALVREQQAKVMDMVENTGMVCTGDLVEDYEIENIHPSRKIPVAKRLACWALSRDYGFDAIKPLGPRFKSMELLDSGELKVSFDGSDCGFIFKGDIKGFEVAGHNKEWHPATAVRRRPDATVLYVSCYAVQKPEYLRYNFKNADQSNLWDSFGNPVVPFRTDNFDCTVNHQGCDSSRKREGFHYPGS